MKQPSVSPNRDPELGRRLQALRARSGLSIRKLAAAAGVTAGMISFIERGRNSPSLATLRKILAALGTDLGAFFSTTPTSGMGPVYPRQSMPLIADKSRRYTLVFPKHKEIQVEMLDETQFPTAKPPPFECLKCDVAGYVLSGSLRLELKGRPLLTVRPGDSFYVPRQTVHRGYPADDPVRLITVYSPPRY
jgi:transcriptional regulator with XRE-family HTH domain